MIIGNSGTGKSATMKYVSLLFQKDGFEIKPINETREIMHQKCNHKKQVFVVDDILGKYQVDRILLDFWRKDTYLKMVFKDDNTKLLCTLRRHLQTDIQQFLTEYNTKVVDLESRDIALSETEKKGMLENYLSLRNKQIDISDDELQEICSCDYAFPLLCNLFTSTAEFSRRKARFFRSPSTFFKKELDNFKRENNEVYCVLVLNTIFDSDELEQIYDITCEIDRRGDFNLILQACEVEESIPRIRLYKKLLSLSGVFVSTLNPFTFIHDNLEETIACHFGTQFPEIIIKCCKSEFLRERVRIEKYETDDQNVLFIQQSCFYEFSKRALKEITDGKFRDILLSEPFQRNYYIEYFLSYLKEMKISENHLEGIHCTEIILPSLCQVGKDFKTVTNTNKVALMQSRKRLFIHWTIATGNQVLFEQLFGRKMIARRLYEKFAIMTDLLHISAVGENIAIMNSLIKNGGNVNSCDEYGIPLLCKVAGTNRIDIAKLLIEKGADVNSYDEVLGWTPCFVASWFNEIEMLELLLSKGCEANTFDFKFRTPLAIAVMKNNRNAVSVLLRYEAVVYDKIYYFELPVGSNRILQEALQNGNYDIVEKLKEFECVSSEISVSFPWCFRNVDVIQKMLDMFLEELKKHTLCNSFWNDFIKICDAIHNNNMGILCKVFNKGETIALYSHCESVNAKYLRQQLSNFNQNYLQFSPLHFAAVCDATVAAKILMMYGANPFQRDCRGRTSFHLASSSRMLEILLTTNYTPSNRSNISWDMFCRNKIVDCLTFKFVPSVIRIFAQSTSNLNVKDELGNTPLHSIVKRASDVEKCLFAVETLIVHGADPCIRCNKGFLPLDHFRTISPFFNEFEVDRGENILGCSETRTFIEKEKTFLITCIILFVIGVFWMYFSDAKKICFNIKYLNKTESELFSNESQFLRFHGMCCTQLISIFVLHWYVLNSTTFLRSFVFGRMQITPLRRKLYAETMFVTFSSNVSRMMICIRLFEIIACDMSHRIGQTVLNLYCLFLCSNICLIYFPFPFKQIIHKHQVYILTVSKIIMVCFVIIWIGIIVMCNPKTLLERRLHQEYFFQYWYYIFEFGLQKMITWYLFFCLFLLRFVKSLFFNSCQPVFWHSNFYSVISTYCILIFFMSDILFLPTVMFICNV